MAQELETSLKELALCRLGAESMTCQSRQDSRDVLQVLVQRPRVGAGVIDELADISSIDVLPQHVGDIALECLQSLLCQCQCLSQCHSAVSVTQADSH